MLEPKVQPQAFYATHLSIGQFFHKNETATASVFFSSATRSLLHSPNYKFDF